MTRRAQQIRDRLLRPPNARVDIEIDLGRQSNAARAALQEIRDRERIEAEQLKLPAKTPEQKCKGVEYPKPAPIRIPIFDVERVTTPTGILPIESFSAVRRIQISVADAYGFGRIEIVSRRRGGGLIRPRQIAMYLCTILTIRSLPDIGRAFDRDHTTILHARDKIARLRKTDAKLNGEIEALIAKLGITEAA